MGVVLLELFSGTIMPAQKDRIALEYVSDCKAKLNANPISVMIKGLLEADPTVRCVWHKQRSRFFAARSDGAAACGCAESDDMRSGAAVGCVCSVRGGTAS